jgi:hypothetical protein
MTLPANHANKREIFRMLRRVAAWSARICPRTPRFLIPFASIRVIRGQLCLFS